MITKVFKSGNSQAVRLPKAFQLDCNEVEIIQRDDELIIRKIPENIADAFKLLGKLSEDFFEEGREDLPPQPRDLFE